MAMGRREYTDPPEGKVTIRKLRLDRGGYCPWGCYFGNLRGTAVYQVEDERGAFEAYVRAGSRADVLEDVRRRFPGYTFTPARGVGA